MLASQGIFIFLVLEVLSPPFSIKLSGYLSVHTEDLKLTSILIFSVLNVVLLGQFVGKIDLEEEIISGSVLTNIAVENETSEILPYEEGNEFYNTEDSCDLIFDALYSGICRPMPTFQEHLFSTY